jgi:hypothetical protein
MSETKIPIKAIKTLQKAAKKLNLSDDELSGCKLALKEISKKHQ